MQDLDAWPVLRECKSNPELCILTHLHCPGLAQNHLGSKTHLFDQTACAVQVNGKTIALKKKKNTHPEVVQVLRLHIQIHMENKSHSIS